MERQNPEINTVFEESAQEYSNDLYKFISLKLFADGELLHGNNRKYRSVFQSKHVVNIYGELSFYNLYFMNSDWDMDVVYKIKTFENELLAETNFNISVSKDEPVFSVFKGFGSQNNSRFWKKGEYQWEVWIEDKCIAAVLFFVENLGYSENLGMPYILLEEVKLFDNENLDLFGTRSYCKCFPVNVTKEVDIELHARNLLHETCVWSGEFIFLFKTELGELKAELRTVDSFGFRDIKIKVDSLHENKTSFSHGIYYVEVIFMEKLIARVPFKIGDREIKSTVEDHRKLFPRVKTYFKPKINEDEITVKLDELIGLEEVKTTIGDQLTYFKYLNLKQSRGITENEKINLNSLFIGNPGTGKTVVANMLGKIYYDMGLLSSGHVYEVGRPELVAEYIGHTALKVKQAIEKARGGVLFIDEAYSLAREKGDKRDFGNEVIEVLLKEMSDGPGDIAIIAAGYSDEMNIFLESNPGLKSRFKHTFHFKDYTPDELLQIAVYYSHKKKLQLTPLAKKQLQKILIKAWRSRDKTFGNARLVNEIIDKAEMNLSLRVMKYHNLDTIMKSYITSLESRDFKNAISSSSKPSSVRLPVDEEGLSEAMNELNSLTGLSNVKTEVEKLTKLIRYYNEEGINPLSKLSLHSVFTGNPGTGKTTVARIMAMIFCSLGILERGHLIECSRESLVSGYTGQTAIKTAKMIEKAIGGVLFIDEAYSLAGTNDNDFGKEVIETLLKKMEDRRGEFIVITAGYTDQMQYFLDSNPGLRSRFDRVIEFPDYSEEELIEIASALLKSNNIEMNGFMVYVDFIMFISKLFKNRGRNFANAREVRKLIEQIVINQNLRVSEIPKSERSEKITKELESGDFMNLNPDSPPSRQPIGFA